MKTPRIAGHLLILGGLGHTVFGLVMGIDAVVDTVEAGIWNGVYEAHLSGCGYDCLSNQFLAAGNSRPVTFWFLWAGFALLPLGYFALWFERTFARTVPQAVGWALVAFAGAGVILVPVSGIWGWLATGAWMIWADRRDERQRGNPNQGQP